MNLSTLCRNHIAYAESLQQQQFISTPIVHRHQNQQRKHSHTHSPNHSQHTSPHSHHSFSEHSSPHQSRHHMHDIDSFKVSSHPLPRLPTNTHHQSQSHRRRRLRHNHQQQNGNGNVGHGPGPGDKGGSSNSNLHRQFKYRKWGVRASSSRHHSHKHSNGGTRRHQSATDISSTSINTCHDPTCVDRKVEDVMVTRICCGSSGTELAQYFAEDLYGSTRPHLSCCTSPDYCYQTDSTSLYGSRSSLSRNNSFMSASVSLRQRRLHQRQPSYPSVSLSGLNVSGAESQPGSLCSVFDCSKEIDNNGSQLDKDISTRSIVVKSSNMTIERQTSKEALSNDLPDYACSPSPIRWSFLADGKSSTEVEQSIEAYDIDPWTSIDEQSCKERSLRKWEHQNQHLSQHRSRKVSHDECPRTSTVKSQKYEDKFSSYDFEESSTTLLFHQEVDFYKNCCNKYIQCNTYLDQDLQITSEDIHQYLSKGNQQSMDVLNNSKNYPFQPSNALEFQYKNNFTNNNAGAGSSDGGDSVHGYEIGFQRNSSKGKNLNQNSIIGETGFVAADSEGTGISGDRNTPLLLANMNLPSNMNSINTVFGNYSERNAIEVKFNNTAHCTDGANVSKEAHHSGFLTCSYPSYDSTNMSANSIFDKPLDIDEIPKDSCNTAGSAIVQDGSVTGCLGTERDSPAVTATSPHSSFLNSPVSTGIFFESFDVASNQNLISCRESCHISPTPRSSLSPASYPCMSASVNPSAMNTHQTYVHYQAHGVAPHNKYQKHYHRHHHFAEGLKFSNALKKVRKRVRKYTDFFRKK